MSLGYTINQAQQLWLVIIIDYLDNKRMKDT